MHSPPFNNHYSGLKLHAMSKNISIYQKRICRHYEENEKISYVRAFIRKKAESNVSAISFAKENNIPSTTFLFWIKKYSRHLRNNNESQFVHVSKSDNSLNIGKSNLINIKYHDAEITTSLNMISDVLNVIRHLDR